jgi:hypothetical protein
VIALIEVQCLKSRAMVAHQTLDPRPNQCFQFFSSNIMEARLPIRRNRFFLGAGNDYIEHGKGVCLNETTTVTSSRKS